MLKKRISKIAFVLACIVTLIMPYTSTVLAAALTQTDTKANLQVLINHEGGEEASGTLTNDQKEKYDINPYGYKLGVTQVYKIIVKGDLNYENAFYCLNAVKSFPGVTAQGYDSLEYTNVANLKDSTDSNVKALHLSTEYAQDSAKWTANYKALIWLLNNAYLEKQAPKQKDDYLAKAFAGYTKYDVADIKAMLTDDDIDVVQQAAIWYFTNGDNEKYAKTTYPTVTLSTFDPENLTPIDGSYRDITGDSTRQELCEYLYQYLITSAKEGKTEAEVTYPTLNTDVTNTTETNKDYYVMGPIKVTSGTAPATQYDIKLIDQNENEIARSEYKVRIGTEDTFTDKNIDEIFDQDYYILLPKSNKTVTSMTVTLEYTSYETEASLWENPTVDENGVKIYQPVTLVTRENTPHKVKKSFNIDRSTADLALRKYIVKVNGEEVDRRPVVDVSKLKDGTSTTAEYKHAKSPITIKAGDTVVYEIRVYNEADINATGVKIIDALPTGLALAENSSINDTYGWTELAKATNTSFYSTDYLTTKTIEAFDKENGTTLDSAYVQMECKVTSDAKASSTLTNVAEIFAAGIEDRDSAASNNDYTHYDYDASNYTGNNSNKKDLTDKNYFYQGREDDDDFEKVYVEGKIFDLAIKKFITKVNGNAPKTSREPVVDVSKLKDGTSTDATYTTVKTPLNVSKGDIITYTIRVYNEGEIAGYAEEVADLIPEGLGFLVGHTTNVDNHWAIPQNPNTIKLKDIDGAKAHLSLDDFKSVKSLDEVDVVVGSAKLTSTKLKSSTSSDSNLIKAFDKENGTKLDYKDIQVTCVVLADKVSGNNFRNIAEITKDLDENKKEIDDIDSTPDNVDPDKYPQNQEDDDDDETLTTSPDVFDLALQKFITAVNKKAVTDREPKATVDSNGKVTYTGNKTPIKVENNDLITYTIRVYNEGDIDGYAKEVADNIPTGLKFVKDNETNKKFGWKLYDKNGNETSDLSAAVSVKTDYLSKAASEKRGDNCLIKAFNASTDKAPAYKDVQLVFQVDYAALAKSENKSIVNIAEITDDSDKDGNPVDDKDSTPGNNKDGEDDLDKEEVVLKVFDLALTKDLVKIVITENGTTREIAVNSTDGLQKVEIHRKKLASTTVKFVYNITVKNEGEIAGYATEITDYVPQGLEFISDENKQWTKVSDSVITTNALSNKLLQPGESASVQVVLKWTNSENNLGLKTNTAEISADKNDSNTPDRDSTPNNKVPTEDDIDTAEVFLAISTGTAPTYFVLATVVLVIMATGVALIKKYVLI